MKETLPTETNAGAELGFKISGPRWIIVGMIFFPTLINCIDRLIVSVVAPKIAADLNLTNTDFLTAPGLPGSFDKGEREQRGVRLAISTKQPVKDASFKIRLRIRP